MSALLRHELRSIVAGFRRRPLVPFVATLMLALGIGANVAVFTVIRRTLLRPLPYARPDRLLVLQSTFVGPDKREEPFPSGSLDIVQWQQRSRLFSTIAAMRGIPMTVRGDGDPQSVAGANVTGRIFKMFGVRPELGRDFVDEDDVPNASVAIITDRGWRRYFGGDPHAVGRSVLIDGHRVSIIGVLPTGFEMAAAAPQPDLFIPAGLSPTNMPSPAQRGYIVYGRLRDGVTTHEAETEVRRISLQVANEFRDTHDHWSGTVRTISDVAFGDRRHALTVLWLSVVLLHLLACVNVASLLAAQIADERGMTALRLAFGAGRRHILRYRLAESALIAAAGALLGLALGSLALRIALASQTDPNITTPVAGAWVMPLFLVALTAITSIAVAVAPALRESHTSLSAALSEQGTRASSSLRSTRLRELFTIIEVALAVPLLLAAISAVQHFRTIVHIDLGFDPRHVLVSQIAMPERYATKERRGDFARDLIRRLESSPGIASAAVTTCNFAPGSAVTTLASTEKFPEPMSVNSRRITPHYFDTMHIPIIAGRTFTDADTSGSPQVAVVSLSLAKQFYPAGNAVGQRIKRGSTSTLATIIGVVPDVRDDGASVEPKPTYYAAYMQGNFIYLTLVVRTLGDPLPMRTTVRRAIWSLDRDITPGIEADLSVLMNDAIGAERLQTDLLAGFAAIALILASVGIYAMTAYSVARRTREIGVRLAFGATPSDVTAEVVRRAVRSVSIGLAAGIAIAWLAQRTASLVVYGAAAFEPSLAAGVIVVLFAVAVLSAWVPSLRARAVRPALLLRDA